MVTTRPKLGSWRLYAQSYPQFARHLMDAASNPRSWARTVRALYLRLTPHPARMLPVDQQQVDKTSSRREVIARTASTQIKTQPCTWVMVSWARHLILRSPILLLVPTTRWAMALLLSLPIARPRTSYTSPCQHTAVLHKLTATIFSKGVRFEQTIKVVDVFHDPIWTIYLY